MKSGVLALILAGGRGTRMGPLCLHRAKPLLPMGIQHRLIDFPIENSLTSGLDHVAVLADYRRQSLVAYIDQRRAARVQPLRQFDILKPASGSYAGTADAVFQNLSYLEASGTETVLVLAADHVYDMDYGPMLQFHHQRQADVTIGVVPIPREEAQRFGAAAMDDESKVITFQEKPIFPLGNLGSMGIYVFSMDYLSRILCRDAVDPASAHDFGHSILPRAVEEGANVFGYRFSGFWQDVGTVESFYRTSMLVLRSAPWARPVALPENEPSTAPSSVGLRGRIHNSLIAPDSHVLGDVYNSI
ncbi:MAG: NTP transferase domain-containing protein, partial [Chloroflexi bacterium]|nr:NTP transferase domain-containing protein [Chloroflexota bacterium]